MAAECQQAGVRASLQQRDKDAVCEKGLRSRCTAQLVALPCRTLLQHRLPAERWRNPRAGRGVTPLLSDSRQTHTLLGPHHADSSCILRSTLAHLRKLDMDPPRMYSVMMPITVLSAADSVTTP